MGSPNLQAWQRNSQLIERRGVEYARGRGFRFVTCGHTHFPMVAAHGDVLYINSGTWTEAPPCPFVTVRGKDVRLEYWPLAAVAADEEISLSIAESVPPPLPAMEEAR